VTSPLLLLPGLLTFSARRSRPGGAARLALFAVMAAIFLYASMRIDAIVFLGLAGPCLMAAPLLALSHRGGLYAFIASLSPLALCAFLVLPLLRDGYDRQFVFPRAGLAGLGIFAALALALVLVRVMASLRERSPAFAARAR
jgi:hypothetical protein